MSEETERLIREVEFDKVLLEITFLQHQCKNIVSQPYRTEALAYSEHAHELLQVAIKTWLLITGGAVIALPTFIGVLNTFPPDHISALSLTLSAFIASLLFTVGTVYALYKSVDSNSVWWALFASKVEIEAIEVFPDKNGNRPWLANIEDIDKDIDKSEKTTNKWNICTGCFFVLFLISFTIGIILFFKDLT